MRVHKGAFAFASTTRVLQGSIRVLHRFSLGAECLVLSCRTLVGVRVAVAGLLASSFVANLTYKICFRKPTKP